MPWPTEADYRRASAIVTSTVRPGMSCLYQSTLIGLAIGAHLLHVPPKWIGVGILCLVGIGIARGVTKTREKDPTSRG